MTDRIKAARGKPLNRKQSEAALDLAEKCLLPNYSYGEWEWLCIICDGTDEHAPNCEVAAFLDTLTEGE